MKIAVWLDSSFSSSDGGCYSYNNRLIKAIDEYAFPNELEICFATLANHEISGLKREVIRLDYKPNVSWIEKLKCSLPVIRWHVRECVSKRIASERKKQYLETLKHHGVKLIYYINQFPYIVEGFPFVVTHWDIGHRSSYAFPELCNEAFRERELYYKDVLPRALMIFVESKAGLTELVKYTSINENRIRVVPLFSGECSLMKVPAVEQVDILDSLALTKGKFFFYPAQFWPEKNHYTIIQSFAKLKKRHLDFKIVFTGSRQESAYGTMEYNKSVAKQLNIDTDVVFAGFVSLETIYTLYCNSCAMIMASYVGPTNMPPLEAMELGCPVICSDLAGHREELGDAALYFNPMNVEELVEAMETMIEQREKYVKKINEQREKSVFRLEHALEAINTHLRDAVSIRECWE